MSANREDLLKLLRLLDITAVEEIDCTEFLHRAAGFVERFDPNGAHLPEHDDVVRHLKLCPECMEEFAALYEALRAEG